MARSTVANNIGNDIPRRTLAANFLTCSPVLHNISIISDTKGTKVVTTTLGHV